MTTWTILLLVYLILSLSIPLVLRYMKKWLDNRQKEYNDVINVRSVIQIVFLIPGFGTSLVFIFWLGIIVRTTKKLLGYPVKDIDN